MPIFYASGCPAYGVLDDKFDAGFYWRTVFDAVHEEYMGRPLRKLHAQMIDWTNDQKYRLKLTQPRYTYNVDHFRFESSGLVLFNKSSTADIEVRTAPARIVLRPFTYNTKTSIDFLEIDE